MKNTSRGEKQHEQHIQGRKKHMKNTSRDEKNMKKPSRDLLVPSGRNLVASGGRPGGPREAPVRKSMVLWRGSDRFQKNYQILSMKVAFLATRQAHVQKHLIKVKKNNARMEILLGKSMKN